MPRRSQNQIIALLAVSIVPKAIVDLCAIVGLYGLKGLWGGQTLHNGSGGDYSLLLAGDYEGDIDVNAVCH